MVAAIVFSSIAVYMFCYVLLCCNEYTIRITVWRTNNIHIIEMTINHSIRLMLTMMVIIVVMIAIKLM